jgi:hypothetical protein
VSLLPPLPQPPREDFEPIKKQIAENLARLGRPVDGFKLLQEAAERVGQSVRFLKEQSERHSSQIKKRAFRNEN